MGFLRDYAVRVDFNKRKREALTGFYEATTELNFLESRHADGLATPDKIREQRELVERLRRELKAKFDVDA